MFNAAEVKTATDAHHPILALAKHEAFIQQGGHFKGQSDAAISGAHYTVKLMFRNQFRQFGA